MSEEGELDRVKTQEFLQGEDLSSDALRDEGVGDKESGKENKEFGGSVFQKLGNHWLMVNTVDNKKRQLDREE